MVTTARTQKRYDHRLRELVRTTQDLSLALQHGVDLVVTTLHCLFQAWRVETLLGGLLGAPHRERRGTLFDNLAMFRAVGVANRRLMGEWSCGAELAPDLTGTWFLGSESQLGELGHFC